MSDQRKERAELKQGLHQFLMQLYVNYSQSLGRDEAKALVQECIDEEYKYFNPEGLKKNSAKEELSAKIKELTDKVDSTRDYDTQLYYAEKIDALQAALDALEIKIS
jgi:polyhydroxyalkanoate synthesis regulator phasin